MNTFDFFGFSLYVEPFTLSMNIHLKGPDARFNGLMLCLSNMEVVHLIRDIKELYNTSVKYKKENLTKCRMKYSIKSHIYKGRVFVTIINEHPVERSYNKYNFSKTIEIYPDNYKINMDNIERALTCYRKLCVI